MPPGAGNRVFQLTDASVSPTRVVGRTEDGLPIEETIPQIKHEMFVDPAGNICPVLLRNGRAAGNSPAEERYEDLTRRELISSGWLPLNTCPYTSEYMRLTNSSTLLGEIPDGVKPCKGHPDGCEHLQPVIKARLAKTRAKWEEQQHDEKRAVRQAEMIAKASATAAADAVSSALDARKNLRAGKGE